MGKKKIEPTDRMTRDVETWGEIMGVDDSDLLRYILNHPDAPGLFAADEDAADARPWEPLNGGRVYVGDEVRQDRPGITITAVVVRVDKDGDPWATDGIFIGEVNEGTWYVRRAIQELPTEDGAVIVPADGHEYIEIRAGKKSRRLTWDADAFVWYDAYGTYLGTDITPGTWKVEEK